jgi:hypothetical protein
MALSLAATDHCSHDHTPESVLNGTIARKIGQMAERSGLSREQYMALLDQIWSRRADVAIAIGNWPRLHGPMAMCFLPMTKRLPNNVCISAVSVQRLRNFH